MHLCGPQRHEAILASNLSVGACVPGQIPHWLVSIVTLPVDLVPVALVSLDPGTTVLAAAADGAVATTGHVALPRVRPANLARHSLGHCANLGRLARRGVASVGSLGTSRKG